MKTSHKISILAEQLEAVLRKLGMDRKRNLLKLIECKHKWIRDGELYVKCEKCGEEALYVGESPLIKRKAEK